MNGENARQFLSPDTVAKLSSMELKARLVVEGFLTGLHKSPYHGFSVEFTEHRPYIPGEDIRHIDWKVYGKTGKYYVKQYEEETNVKTYILLDASRSMGYASKNRDSKLRYGALLAASLAYLMHQQRDAVGLTLYDSSVRVSLPPRVSRPYLKEVLRTLEHAVPSGTTGTGAVLHATAENIRRRGLVVIISDLLDDVGQVTDALHHFRFKGHEVIVMHVLDPMERSFDFGEDAQFVDMETGDAVTTQPWHIRKAYRESMNDFIAVLQRQCREMRAEYVLADTATPFDFFLTEYLHKRRRLM